MLGYLFYLSALYCFLIFYVYRRALKLKFDPKTALDFGIVAMIFGFWGARLFHVFYENPEVYREDWRRVFYFWNGGFVFYGGALAGYFACLFMAIKRKLPVAEWSDFFAPVIALGYGLGRVSCMIAGCCYGKVCDAPWAHNGRYPTQMFAVIWELLGFFALIYLGRKKKLQPGNLFWLYLAWHSVGRMIMEHYRDDFRGGLYAGYSVSTWISIALLLTAVFKWRRTQDHSL